MDDMKSVRIGLITLYVASSVASMVTFIIADDVNWLVTFFAGLSSFCFYVFIATFLWWLMPHKLLEFYTGTTPWVVKILVTVFWLDVPLFITAFGGVMIKNHMPPNPDWHLRLSVDLAQYIAYFGGLFVFGLFGMFVFGIFTDRISFARPVFIVNRRDRD